MAIHWPFTVNQSSHYDWRTLYDPPCDLTCSVRAQPSLVLRASSFALGLATTLAALGMLSSLGGRAYGQIGEGLPIAVALVAMLMGLNLLGVVQLRLPSLDVDIRSPQIPPVLQVNKGKQSDCICVVLKLPAFGSECISNSRRNNPESVLMCCGKN